MRIRIPEQCLARRYGKFSLQLELSGASAGRHINTRRTERHRVLEYPSRPVGLGAAVVRHETRAVPTY